MSDFITNAELRIESERLCDENERLEAENAELRHDLEEANNQAEEVCIENAKLREERDYYKALWEHATVTDCELRRVRAAWKEDREKNAKLRELVEDMLDCIQIRAAFSRPPTEEMYEMFYKRARELGVDE